MALALLGATADAAPMQTVQLRGSIVRDAGPDVRLLEIWVNGHRSDAIARVEVRGRQIFVAGKAIADAGISAASANDNARVDIAAVSGISARIDEKTQRLIVTAAPSRLARRVYDLSPSPARVPVSASARGVALGYDVSATDGDLARAGSSLTGGAAADLTIFGPGGRFAASAYARTGLGKPVYRRLDMALIFDNPSGPSRITLGDAISGAASWSRAVRFGGLQIASDYTLQPDRVTFPLPDFFGMAAVPETLDVYVGAARVFEQHVPEGPFELRNLPVLTGGGSATVDVTDVLGRTQSQTVSLFTNGALLAPGLSSFAFDAGFLRRKYGLEDNAYATPMLAGTWARGITNALTLDMHGEFAPGLYLGGGGATFRIGSVGVLSADLAASGGDRATGYLATLSGDARFGPVTLFSDIAVARGPFTDLAARDGPSLAHLRYRMGANYGSPRFGTFAVSWIGQKRRHEDATDLLSASYSRALGGGLYFGATGLRDFGARAWAGEIYLSVPFGNAGIASATASTNASRESAILAFDSPANPDGGFGWRAVKGFGENGRIEGDATWAGEPVRLDAAISHVRGTTALRADADGQIVFLHGRIFATRKREGAMALVMTGAPGVRIYRENRDVAKSDAGGLALLTGLSPYAANRIAVEPRDYPMSSIVARAETTIAPPRDGAVLVDLAPAARHPALVRIADWTGAPMALGSRATIDGRKTPLIVGRGGILFIPDLASAVTARIEANGTQCRVEIPAPPPTRGIAKIGPLPCEDFDVR